MADENEAMPTRDQSPRRITHSRYATEDPLEAREFVEEAYGARLRVAAVRERRAPLTLDRIQAGEVELADLDLPLDLMMGLPGRGEYVFATVVDGTAEYERDGETTRYARGDTYLGIKPDGEEVADTEHLHVRTVSLPAALLDELAGDGEGPAEWSFTSMRPLTGGARRWRQTVTGVGALLAELDGEAAPLVDGAAARLLAATALSVFPNTAVAVTADDGRGDAHPDTLRRAVGFIEANPDLDIGLADIARSAYVSPRTIQLAFRRHLDTTPTAYLRRVRLDHARRQLQAADPEAGDRITVTRVAIEWGFANPGRFARYYRAAFGESPAETLKGRRGR
jgi:AraC-like DNA-binding protein